MKRPSRECAMVAPMFTAREGELSAEELSLLQRHLSGCDGCRLRAAEFRPTEGVVGEALLAEAAEVDFSRFADQVMERVARAGASTTAPAGAYARHERDFREARDREPMPVRPSTAPAQASTTATVPFAPSVAPPEAARSRGARASTTAPAGAYARHERDSSWSRILSWARAHRAAAVAGTLAPTLAAAALIVYLATSGTPVSSLGEVEVVAEGRVPVVLQTSDGPVVLLDEPDET